MSSHGLFGFCNRRRRHMACLGSATDADALCPRHRGETRPTMAREARHVQPGPRPASCRTSEYGLIWFCRALVTQLPSAEPSLIFAVCTNVPRGPTMDPWCPPIGDRASTDSRFACCLPMIRVSEYFGMQSTDLVVHCASKHTRSQLGRGPTWTPGPHTTAPGAQRVQLYKPCVIIKSCIYYFC